MRTYSSTGCTTGFTLIELLVVIAIVTALVVVAAPPLAAFRQQQALQNTTNTVIAFINDARAKTLAGSNNARYSVRLEANQAILFQGTPYDNAAATNQQYLYESPVMLGAVSLAAGGSTITFDRLRGTTSDHGTLQLQLPNGTSRTITVTATGSVARN